MMSLRARIYLARSIMRGFGDTVEGSRSRWRSRGTWKSTCPWLLLSCLPPSASLLSSFNLADGMGRPEIRMLCKFSPNLHSMSTNEWNDLIWKHQKKVPLRFPRRLFIAATILRREARAPIQVDMMDGGEGEGGRA